MGKNYVFFDMVGPELWEASKFFNANAYPDHLKRVINDCLERFALILYHSKVLKESLHYEKRYFIEQINAPNGPGSMKINPYTPPP